MNGVGAHKNDNLDEIRAIFGGGSSAIMDFKCISGNFFAKQGYFNFFAAKVEWIRKKTVSTTLCRFFVLLKS